MTQDFKVVTAEEMARVEKLAIASGCSEEKFMEMAGQKVGAAALHFATQKQLSQTVTLLVGKGNNGGDAYVAGIFLLDAGFQVRALAAYPSQECSPLNQKFGALFKKRGGVVEKIEGTLSFAALVIDGFLGTGFKGNVDGVMGSAILQANRSRRPILAIDIPSGLNGTTGEIGGCAIEADVTVALGLPKIGFYLRDGWNCVGEVRVADFGLPGKFIERAKPLAYLQNEKELKLPKVIRTRHKYQAGYVLGLGGSAVYRGAMKLAGLACLRSGAGIVRLFTRGDIGPAPLELICQRWNEREWKKELERAGAVFIGPGSGSIPKGLGPLQVPCVIDADALTAKATFPKGAILTPHRGEMLRLLGLKKAPTEEELFDKVAQFSSKREVFVVLKGAPTFVFSPGAVPTILCRGDPGMATAGSGDVLTGVIAALLAQGVEPGQAALLGVTLHGLAGEIAAREKTSYSLIASDLIESLPQAFLALLPRGIL